MRTIILSAVAVLSVLAPTLASAQVQRAVLQAGDSPQLITVDDDRRWRREHRREHRRDRREWRRDRREDRREWRDDRRNYNHGYRDGRRSSYYYYAPPPSYGYGYGYRPGYSYGYHQPRFVRGAVLPYEYRRYVVRDYYDYGWAPPPPGYAYYRADTGEIILAAIATGLILSVIAGGGW